MWCWNFTQYTNFSCDIDVLGFGNVFNWTVTFCSGVPILLCVCKTLNRAELQSPIKNMGHYHREKNPISQPLSTQWTHQIQDGYIEFIPFFPLCIIIFFYNIFLLKYHDLIFPILVCSIHREEIFWELMNWLFLPSRLIKASRITGINEA